MTERYSEPSAAELQHTALAAREQLIDSLGRLDQRVKHLAGTAANASAASGWGIAAACAWWVSATLGRPRQEYKEYKEYKEYQEYPRRFGARRGLGATLLTTALKAVGFVATGVMVYAAVTRARRAADIGVPTAPQLTADAAPTRATLRDMH